MLNFLKRFFNDHSSLAEREFCGGEAFAAYLTKMGLISQEDRPATGDICTVAEFGFYANAHGPAEIPLRFNTAKDLVNELEKKGIVRNENRAAIETACLEFYRSCCRSARQARKRFVAHHMFFG